MAFLGLPVSPVRAELPPDGRGAREWLRERERERVWRRQWERRPDVRLGVGVGEEGIPALPESEMPCFLIGEIRLDDPSGRLGGVAAAADPPGDPATGRCLGSRGINQVMARLQNALIERGYVTTRVLAEAQDLRAGVLTLTLVPGRLRAVRFSEDSDPRATAWNAFPGVSGDLVDLRDIEQALENWQRVPTVAAEVRIVPGAEPGESDLVVVWKQAFPWRLTLSLDDGGTEATGRIQGSVVVSADHLLALNDLFYASRSGNLGGGSGRRGTRGATVHYSLPFGYWMLGVTRSTHRYHQSVAGAYQSYRYRGTGENHEIRLSRLVYRDAVHKTTISLRAYLSQSGNFIDDTEIEVQRRRMAGWAASIGHRAFLAGAVLDFELAWRRGTGAWAALVAPEDAFGEGTARPRIVHGEASLSLPFRLFGRPLRYHGQWRAQWNRTPLVAQDRFSIGGRYTVRGFDGESILLAERGFLMRNDVSLPFGDGRQEIYAGLDHGRVGGRSADLLVGRGLTGAVLGWRGAWRALSWDVFTAAPVRKPDGFATDPVTAGCHLTLSL
ncbi:MAG: ShlB/FhaC/HecB family hemolysin secretion/activation protein [Opitutaceae bacterium]|nr:ShlB/FhaC/HecB family hemolysin secretion/activation protein [Opitutaceae bacterium]